MGTIELGEYELKVLEAIIDKMEEVDLNSNEKVYRIRNIYVLLYNHFKENEASISRQAIYQAVDTLEKVGLLKIVAKTRINNTGKKKFVYELQLERFDKSKIIKIEKHYRIRKESGKTENQPKLNIKGGGSNLYLMFLSIP